MSLPTIVAIAASGLLAILVVILFFIVRYQRRQFSRAATSRGAGVEVAAVGDPNSGSTTTTLAQQQRASLRRYNNDPSSIPAGELDQFFGTDEAALQSFELARQFESTHPPASVSLEFTPEVRAFIQEKGVTAWQFIAPEEVNAVVQERTEITFAGGEGCLQTNLPLPKAHGVYYFEVKLYEKPEETNVGVGLTTKPYPHWRMPGYNKHSIGLITKDGRIYHNNPFQGNDTRLQIIEGDVIGCGFQPRSGTVFFTRNGKRLGSTRSGIFYDMFPTVAADGFCRVSVNLGQSGFVFIEANVKKWGLAPAEGTLAPPPAYGADRDSILLESGSVVSHVDEELFAQASTPNQARMSVNSGHELLNMSFDPNADGEPSPLLAVPPPTYSQSLRHQQRLSNTRDQPQSEQQEQEPFSTAG